MLVCGCNDWKNFACKEFAELNAFVHCPWCGSKLQEDKPDGFPEYWDNLDDHGSKPGEIYGFCKAAWLASREELKEEGR